MAQILYCDVCKKPTAKLAGKLYYSPMNRGGGRKSGHHNEYTHRADVGVCCGKILKLFNFTERTTAEEYHARRNGSTVAKSNGAKIRGTGEKDSETAGREAAA